MHFKSKVNVIACASSPFSCLLSLFVSGLPACIIHHWMPYFDAFLNEYFEQTILSVYLSLMTSSAFHVSMYIIQQCIFFLFCLFICAGCVSPFSPHFAPGARALKVYSSWLVWMDVFTSDRVNAIMRSLPLEVDWCVCGWLCSLYLHAQWEQQKVTFDSSVIKIVLKEFLVAFVS